MKRHFCVAFQKVPFNWKSCTVFVVLWCGVEIFIDHVIPRPKIPKHWTIKERHESTFINSGCQISCFLCLDAWNNKKMPENKNKRQWWCFYYFSVLWVVLIFSHFFPEYFECFQFVCRFWIKNVVHNAGYMFFAWSCHKNNKKMAKVGEHPTIKLNWSCLIMGKCSCAHFAFISVS